MVDDELLVVNCSSKPITFCQGPTVVGSNFFEGTTKLPFALIGFRELLAHILKFIVGMNEGS